MLYTYKMENEVSHVHGNGRIMEIIVLSVTHQYQEGKYVFSLVFGC